MYEARFLDSNYQEPVMPPSVALHNMRLYTINTVRVHDVSGTEPPEDVFAVEIGSIQLAMATSLYDKMTNEISALLNTMKELVVELCEVQEFQIDGGEGILKMCKK